ncbi:putative PAP-specific phosphatase, mitochondrial [Malania oleifera]|uniref:putative PAP-specific phosphatase, mitochondrial n=1 Tax=Malania oleifera TaxID=397392 RepID=UPI0025ADB6F2|nr:putative PAP-specific phosphatase, mitochondrial [Malania oleifera]XP_057961226.1 putative PAP-specific phosphatase, mitochondrial [Malania oleifera]XP_057961228.1 putative PAP-specific phosphatase, mitochondrial [Malania oleifera]XP_057961229.1 putative PAP-specific phosphatase, mitochondrial [Malania oleifera]XP_057961230.1 putative PAP-specific phosphatase, mitochondrial [Malania oleifera]
MTLQYPPFKLQSFSATASPIQKTIITPVAVLHSASPFPIVRFAYHHSLSPSLRNHSRRSFTVSSSLPFSQQNAKYHIELQAAVDIVERACHLCVDVKSSLFSTDGRVLEKNDQTPVTVADFGVQALVSLELHKLFPSIPLVAEEDSAFLRSNNLADFVVHAVSNKVSFEDESFTHSDVLDAIDRGGKGAFSFESKPATYWVLDPIDGTRGFLKGSEALYVVGLALIIEGEIVLGVMGCPNFQQDFSNKSVTDVLKCEAIPSGSPGIIMIAHVGCGTWMRKLSYMVDATSRVHDSWTRCFVDGCRLVHQARFCIPDSQVWELLPLSAVFNSTTNADIIGEREILLLPTCCGSLCKYLMVASGRASVFILQAKIQTIIKAWDHAVGMICVYEAGGKVTDWKGSLLDLAGDQAERRVIYPSGGVLVTNGNLHSKILEIISSSSSVV